MVGEINRKKDASSQMNPFHSSWIQVLREYKELYPDGIYSKSLIVAMSLALFCFLISFFLLFLVLPKQRHSSVRNDTASQHDTIYCLYTRASHPFIVSSLVFDSFEPRFEISSSPALIPPGSE
jgi:hypothetical protein